MTFRGVDHPANLMTSLLPHGAAAVDLDARVAATAVEDGNRAAAELAEMLAGIAAASEHRSPPRWHRLARSPAFWIIVAGVVIRLVVIGAPITYSIDAWRQADTASIARNFARHGMRLFMPQINWGGKGPGYVDAEFQLFPFLAAIGYRLIGEHVWIGRAVSLSFSVGTMVAFRELTRRVLSARVALYALCAFVASPIFVRFSVEFMPEATMLCFYVTALALFERWLRTGRSNWLYACAASTSLAVLVKPTSIHIGLVFVLWAVLAGHGRRLRRWPVAAAATGALVPVAAWYLHSHELYTRYGNTFGVVSGGDSKWTNRAILLSRHLYTGIAHQEVRWVMATLAPLVLVGLLAIVRNRRDARRTVPLVLAGAPVLAAYYLIVGRYAEGDLGTQYHIYSAVYASIAAAVGIDTVWRAATHRRLWRAGTTLAALIYLAFTAHTIAGLAHPDGGAEVACAPIVRSTVPPGDLVVISSASPTRDSGVANNYQDPVLFYHGNVHGWSLASDQHRAATLDALRAEGARWFLATSPPLLRGTDLVPYLRARPQVGPGLDRQCAIWDLRGR